MFCSSEDEFEPRITPRPASKLDVSFFSRCKLVYIYIIKKIKYINLEISHNISKLKIIAKY